MAQWDNIITFDSGRSGDRQFAVRDEHRNSVSACRQAVLKVLPRLMERMFETVDDKLYELADKADNNSRQTSYFDAMRELRKQRENIEDSFNGQFLGRFDRFWSVGPNQHHPDELIAEFDSGEFSLVEEDDLEEGLAISNMVAKGENRFFRDLYALDKRFSHVIGGIEIDSKSNPVAPAAVASVFRDLVIELDIDLSAKLIIFKQFEREVIEFLGNLYDELNGILIGAGIIPKLAKNIRRHPVSPALKKIDNGAGNEAGPGGLDENSDEANSISQDLFAMLQGLLEQRRVESGISTPGSAATLKVVQTAELLGALTSIQQAPQAADNSNVIDLRGRLQDQLGTGAGSGRVFGRAEEDVIDVISMLFEFILDDHTIPDAMKTLLSRLQIPMLKVAIQDREFFSKKTHPARQLLNNLAKSAVGWSESKGRTEGGLYTRISTIVERIVNEYVSDVRLFAELNEQFIAFLDRESRGAEIAEARATQVTEGKERLNSTRERVFDQIRESLSGYTSYPEVVAALVADAWKDVLLLVALRKGLDSDDWTYGIDLLDKLLWSVQPKATREERQELLQAIPGLLKGFRAGLTDISYDQHKMTRVFKELQMCHLYCLKGKEAKGHISQAEVKSMLITSTHTVPATAPAREEPVKSADSTDVASQDDASADDTFLEQAKALEVGSWLEMAGTGGERFRAKLAWRSDVSGRCLFVNRKGMKVAELQLEGVALWLKEGRAVAITHVDVPLMDRALTAMVNVLNGIDSSETQTA
ncbi:MAG: DUF1631 domain-containing protein [Candidatus Sedimenticola sp. 20ELBAFRAG]